MRFLMLAEVVTYGSISVDEVPVISYAESRAIWDRNTTVGADGVCLITVPLIHRGDHIRHFRTYKCHFVHMSVA